LFFEHPMSTVPAGGSSYGAFPSTTVAGASRTTVQTPFSNQVTTGLDFRKTRLGKHRLNRTIQTTATVAVVNASVAVATDAINTVRQADRAPAALVNGKRTGRIRRVAQGAISTLGSITGGTGYTSASYTNVPLVRTTGSGSQLLASGAAADITVAGGIVTVCTLVAARNGEGYTVGDVLTAAPGYLGAGTGFSIPVATVTVG
jgi:hypothetical protein